VTCAGRAGRGGRAGRQGREAAGCAGRAQRERVVCAAWRPATWRGVASQKHTASKGVGVKPNCGECVVWKNWSATRRVGELEVVYFTLVLKAAAAKLPQLRRHCSGKLILLHHEPGAVSATQMTEPAQLGGNSPCQQVGHAMIVRESEPVI